MPRHSKPADPDAKLDALLAFLSKYQRGSSAESLRDNVKALIPAFYELRDLGCSLISSDPTLAARDRILAYFLRFPGTVLSGEELMVVSGIQEWARRLRELRVEHGWQIASGVTMKQTLAEEEPLTFEELGVKSIKPDQYILLSTTRDEGAAKRWQTANEIRKRKLSVKEKLLLFLRANIGVPISNEELRYVANNKSEWARRTRELRTEEGWPLVTRTTGRPDLRVGVYVLLEDRQQQPHDRRIPDPERRAALKRDKYTCQGAAFLGNGCSWRQDDWNSADPRHLELHHKKPHAEKGENIAENLVTLCNICHDVVHRKASAF